MTDDAKLQRWILEAVRAVGGHGTSLDVSRQVWAHHRDEIESAGDLFFTWQVELQDTARAMIASRALAADPDTGTWALTGGDGWEVATNRSGWTEDQIEVVVAAYVAMLQDVADGRPARRSQIIADALDRTGRTRAALDAMMSNISAVVQEQGLEPLPAHPPKSNVPAGVRPAVRAALSADPGA